MNGNRAALAAVLVCSACAPALRPPRPLPASPQAAARSAAESTDSLLTRATQRFAARRDPGAAAEAQALFLAAANADRARIEGLIGLVRVAAWRIEHTRDAGERATLLADELDAAQWCGRRSAALADASASADAAAACDYWLAVALGQQAREHPSTAPDALNRVVAALRRAAARLPALEAGGPDRVLALVLLRAPGWPAGPGDAEEGLAAARRAVALAPDYPPNQLALAEALGRNGSRDEARAVATAGRASALAAADPDAAEWVAEADALLQGSTDR